MKYRKSQRIRNIFKKSRGLGKVLIEFVRSVMSLKHTSWRIKKKTKKNTQLKHSQSLIEVLKKFKDVKSILESSGCTRNLPCYPADHSALE